ncbi:MAG: SDR family oxidoreductase [Pseudomonadota bacterium]
MNRTAFIERLFGLRGRPALVTGASSGIGRQLAIALARAGAPVVALARRADALDDVVAEIKAGGGEATALRADLANEPAGAIAEHAARPFGAIVTLINAAGVNLREPAEAVTHESWDETLALNLKVPFFLAQSLVKGMINAGGGSIVNFGSLQSYRAFENGLAYGASKGGVIQLTRAMAREWSAEGVRANAIVPGFFPTELTAPVFGDEAVSAAHARATAVGRNGALADLDGTAIFLAADASRYITGAAIPVDGGYLAT